MYYTRLGKHTVNAVRLAEIMQVLVRHGFADLLRRFGFQDGLPARVLRRRKLMETPGGEPDTFGRRLSAALMDLGPTFVKFGQILSTRPDVVGPEIARDLSQLQDQVEPLPFAAMSQVIVDALGAAPSALFAAFDPTPVASASLSQVYRATLKSGEEVAVKVQRPDIERRIESDLSLMHQLAEWIADHMGDAKLLDPAGVVEEFARSIRRELDFTIEALVIERFAENFEDNEHVFIPQVYREYCGKRILTMDWVDGVRVDRLDQYEARQCDPHTMAVTACEIICRMVFEHRLFHADPHPGNIFLLRDNRIAFLDLGMAGHLDESDVSAIADLFFAIFHGNASECVAAVLNLTAQSAVPDRDALEHEIGDFIAFEAQAIISGGQVAKGIERAIEILRRHQLQLMPRFSLLLKALGTVEVVGRQIDPDLDFVPIIQPYIEELILARYQPQRILKEVRRNALGLLRLSRQIPDDLSQALDQLRCGKLTIKVHHEHLDNLGASVDRSSNRNAVSIITAALIIGSSLLITTESRISGLGLAGFVIAGLLGAVLIISILWSRKF